MKKFKVLVERIADYSKVDSFIYKVFDIFGFEDCIYLKPNFLKFDKPENGCITHPEVVKSILKFAKDFGQEMTVIEGGFYQNSASECFKNFGLYKYAECINLNDEEFVEVKINGKALKSAKVAKTAIDARNRFISVPKMKVHHLTKVTLGIKNNMGFLKKPAVYMHIGINQKLVDFLEFANPKLTIIDGIIGGNFSEISPKPVKHGVMVASNNVVACDFISSMLMGFNPIEIEHIRLAMENFKINSEKIEIEGSAEVQKYTLSLLSRFLGKLGI